MIDSTLSISDPPLEGEFVVINDTPVLTVAPLLSTNLPENLKFEIPLPPSPSLVI